MGEVWLSSDSHNPGHAPGRASCTGTMPSWHYSTVMVRSQDEDFQDEASISVQALVAKLALGQSPRATERRRFKAAERQRYSPQAPIHGALLRSPVDLVAKRLDHRAVCSDRISSAPGGAPLLHATTTRPTPQAFDTYSRPGYNGVEAAGAAADREVAGGARP